MTARRVIDMTEHELRDIIADARSDQVDRLAYNIDEAGEALGCSPSKVRDMIASGDLAAARHGKRVFIPIAAVDAFLADADAA